MKKIALIIFTIFLMLIFIPKAEAKLGGSGSGAGGSDISTTMSSQTGLPGQCDSYEYTRKSAYAPFGILVTLSEYDPTSRTENDLSTIMFYTGNLGMDKRSMRCTTITSTSASVAGGQYVGNVYTCEGVTDADTHCNTGHGTTTYNVRTVVFKYHDPTYSDPRFTYAKKVPSPIELDYNNLPNSLESDNGLLKMLLHMNDPEYQETDDNWDWIHVLPKINEELGVNLTIDNITNYYLRVEPIYRYYFAQYIKDGHGGYNDQASNDTVVEQQPMGFDGGFGTQFNPHYHKESWTDYDEIENVESEADCDEGYSYLKLLKKCFKKIGTGTDNCVYYDYITYSTETRGLLPSYIDTPRNSKGKAFLSMLYNVAELNDMPSKNEAGVDFEPAQTDYFIGTTIDTAMVASSNSYSGKLAPKRFHNKYVFANSMNDKYQEDKTIGMVIYALIDFFQPTEDNCLDYCTGDRSSDDFLNCAQNFCDTYTKTKNGGHKTTTKRECIINKCKYVPKSPIDCNNPNSAYNDDFKNLGTGITDNKDITGSTCGFTDGTKTSLTKASNSKIGGYTTCKRIGVDKTEDVNGVTVYAYDTNNTGNSYINVACKETTTADFRDTSNDTLSRGQGLEYYSKLHGNRECILFFDYEQWKFDFAATYSADNVRKTLLLNKVRAFNELTKSDSFGTRLNGTNINSEILEQYALNESESGAVIESTVEDTLELAESTSEDGDFQKLEILPYDLSSKKTNVSSVVTEYVNKTATKKGNIPYSSDNATEKISMDKELTSTINTSQLLTVDSKDTLKLYSDYKYDPITKETVSIGSEGSMEVNRYKFEGTIDIIYDIPEMCNNDGNSGTVTKAVDGKCTSKISGVTDGQRLYYTHNNATATEDLKPLNKNHNIATNIEIKKTDLDGQTMDTKYMYGSDTCTYVIDSSGPKGGVTCYFTLNRKAGPSDPTTSGSDQVCYKSDNLYITDFDTAEIIMNISNTTSNDENVVSHNFKVVDSKGNTVLDSNSTRDTIPVNNLKFTVKAGKYVTNSNLTVTGQVKTQLSDGTIKNYDCAISTYIVAKKQNGCTITKDAANKRFVITKGDSGDVYVTTGNLRDESGNQVFSKITPDDNGNYFFPNLSVKEDEVVIAKIGEGENAQYCQWIPKTCTNKTSCFEECAPDFDEYDVRTYCNTKGKTDGVYYYPNCEEDCGGGGGGGKKRSCKYYITDEKLKEDYDYVSGWCNDPTNLAKTYHENSKDCILTCFNLKGDYKYRSINLNNPFPSSQFSAETGYLGGDRAIGKDWMVNVDTIQEDKTRVIQGKEPEYVVELTPSLINAINADTDFRNSNLEDTSIYSSTDNAINEFDKNKKKFYVCSKNTSNRAYTGYCSAFIHKSEFTSAFKVVDGLKFNGEIS